MNKIFDFFKKYKIYFLFIVLSFLIEALICNYSDLRVLVADEKELEIEYEIVEGMEYFEDFDIDTTALNQNFTMDTKSLIVNKVENDIYNVKFVLKNYNGSEYANFEVLVYEKLDNLESNDTYNYRRVLLNKTIFFEDGKADINVRIDPKTTKELYFNITEYDCKLDFDRVVINTFNYKISGIRTILIFLIILLIYFIKTKRIYKLEYNKNSKKQNISFIMCIIIVLSIIFYYSYNVNFKYPARIFIDENSKNSYYFQTEAFFNKSISLLIEPSEDILSMENPYDHNYKFDKALDYYFDFAYYNNKYYQYFSALPVIFIMLPLKIITGHYFNTTVLTTFLFLIFVVALSVLYKKIINIFINKLKLFNFYLGYLVLIFGSGILEYVRGAMYDFPVTFGMLSLVLSILTIISAYQNPNKGYILKMIIAGILTGFVVMSKPSFIVYYIFIFALLIIYLKKFKDNKKDMIKRILLFFIPLAILGLVQMWYNYVRFDSIFEFGAKYQLTIADMRNHSKFSLIAFLKGITAYLFQLPIIDLFDIPIVDTASRKFSGLGMNEFEFQIDVYGLIYFPMFWAYIFKNKIISKNNENNAKDKMLLKFINLSLLVVIGMIFVNSCFAGITQIYTIDSKLTITLFGLFILFKLLDINSEDELKLEMYNKIFLILATINLVLFLPHSFTTLNRSLTKGYLKDLQAIKNFLKFWT